MMISGKCFKHYRTGGEGGEWSPSREVYETWWKGQFWGAELENRCYTGKKTGPSASF